MAISRQLTLQTLFSIEHECVNHLFRKRWPGGFICPFCGRLQKETAPAYTVFCRYCRKQTSITAQTVMHGSKHSLLSWILVAWQFCCRDQSITAREIQRLMALTSYQTAWTWLQKIRRGAALAESAPCSGVVAFAVRPLVLSSPGRGGGTSVAVAMAMPQEKSKAERVRFGLLQSASEKGISTAVAGMVQAGSTLFLDDHAEMVGQLPDYLCCQSHPVHRHEAEKITNKAAAWLSSTYRRSVHSSYLQSYLDEFAFRYNTASWPDKLLVFEHLLDGLLSSEHAPSPFMKSRENNLTQPMPARRGQ